MELKLFTKYIFNNTLQSGSHKNFDSPIFAISNADVFFPDYVDILALFTPCVKNINQPPTFHRPLTLHCGKVGRERENFI